jgi:hypothetical protein
VLSELDFWSLEAVDFLESIELLAFTVSEASSNVALSLSFSSEALMASCDFLDLEPSLPLIGDTEAEPLLPPEMKPVKGDRN